MARKQCVSRDSCLNCIFLRGEHGTALSRRQPEPRGELRIIQHCLDRCRQRGRVVRRYQQRTVLAGEVRRAAHSGRHDGLAGLHCLLQDQRPGFPPARDGDHVSDREERGHILPLSEQYHVGACLTRLRPECGGQRAVPGDDRARPGIALSPASRGCDQDIQALLRGQAADRQDNRAAAGADVGSGRRDVRC